jgi:hypothetical protein
LHCVALLRVHCSLRGSPLCSEMCGSLTNCSRCLASRRGGSRPRKGR